MTGVRRVISQSIRPFAARLLQPFMQAARIDTASLHAKPVALIPGIAGARAAIRQPVFRAKNRNVPLAGSCSRAFRRFARSVRAAFREHMRPAIHARMLP